MQHREITPKRQYLLRLERGEFVHESIADFCEVNNINAGWFTALGAINDIRLGYYSLETREYYFTHYPEDHEVVTLVGNVALIEDEPFLHIHTTISDTNNQTYGGHLQSAIVAVTLEVHLTAFSEPVFRELDDETGLKLLNCGV